MLVKAAGKQDSVEKNPPVRPISGWIGDKSPKKSENNGTWKGCNVDVGSEKLHVDTDYDEVANEMESMLVKAGRKNDSVDKNAPVMPLLALPS